MKKLLFMIAIAAIVVGCESEDLKTIQIKATDMISIKPASGTALKVKSINASSHLSALEIVKGVTVIQYNHKGIKWERSFTPVQRDSISETPKLLMWATDVITLDGELQPEFIEATDVLFISYAQATPLVRDTIAYISNSTLRAAETAIRSAYDSANTESCYAVFNTAYTFTAITGAEWLDLKRTGSN